MLKINQQLKRIEIKEFEIEHIFPRKWQIANYSEWNRKDAEQYLERYGNKIAFEK
jgi:hypothetical protein